MKTAFFIIGLVLICCEFTEKATTEGQLEGFAETVVQSECRDRYLWIHVASRQTPRFEAVDGDDVHFISEQLASQCGYTISTFKMDGFTTFRASYFSCFTHNQNDEVFTFRFNLMLSDAGGSWISRPVSAVCSGLIWTHREVICEEDYMEVNVNRESSCGGLWGDSGPTWQAAFSQAQRMATSVWQLMILQSDGRVFTMSINEAQRRGYSLTTTPQRVVLRSQYKQPHTELIMVDGVPTEVIRASLFFKQKLMVVMIDVSIACTVNSGSFDGARLFWDIPRVIIPLIGEGAKFESRSLSLGVEGVLLEEPTAARGYNLVQQGTLIQIGVPFGAEGGYRKSLVVNNMYKERYAISLLYEHIFSLLYEDGSSIDTRHRMLRVLETPLLCRPPFSLNQTNNHDQMFSVYLGNIPADVLLEEVWINGKQLMIPESTERGYSISPVVHLNGSRAYELRLPFEDAVVHWMYLGQGVLQYSIDINFTLTLITQRDSYYHHTFITAQVLNAFPPEITAQCSDRGITFSIVRLPRAESLWEVGVDHQPLTSQLVAQRGYHLHNDTQRTTLEVPVFSIGYNYEGINLSNFYGTFKLLLRDSKTLEIQTSTSKRCLFKTQDMIVCSADGTMTVVTTPTSTWPTVQPERTTLLDPTCGPKQTDGNRVLFEFKLDSCGTRAMVGELYMVYENEIIHDRQIIADGPNLISRESQLKLTVRCFYPLNGVNRLSLDRIFRSGTPGFGLVKVFKGVKADYTNELSDQDCLHKVTENPANPPAHQVFQAPAAGVLPQSGIRPEPKPEAGHFITVPAGHNRLLYSSQIPITFPNLNLSPPPEGSTTGTQPKPFEGFITSWSHVLTPDQHVFSSQNSKYLPNFPSRYDQIRDNIVQLSNLNTKSLNFPEMRDKNSALADNPALGFSSSSKIPNSPVVEQLQIDLGSSSQTPTIQGLNSLGANVWHSGLTLDQPTLGQNGIINSYQDLKSPQVDLFTGMQKLTQQHEASLDLSLYGSSGGGMDMAKTVEIQGHQPQNQYDLSQTSQLHPVIQPPGQYSLDDNGSSGPLLPGRDKTYVPAKIKHFTSQNTVTHLSEDKRGSLSTEPTSTETSQVDQNLEKTGSIERRNTEIVQSRVQNIRVKPLSQFVSFGHYLNQKLHVQKTNSQISNPSQHATGPARVKSDRTAVIRLTDLSQNQQIHQQKLVQPVAEKGNSGGQESAYTQRKVLQPAGESHIRVRLVTGLSGRLQTNYVPKPQNPTTQPDTRGGTSRISYPSLTPQSIPNNSDNIREYQLDNFDSDKDFNPTAGGAGFTGSHTGLKGSGSTSSDLNIHTTSDCSGQFGDSVHQGIMRGSDMFIRCTP